MDNTAPAIEIHGLVKRYGKLVALDRLSLDIRKGELFSLLGVNGAGKTTAIKILCGLIHPDGGDAHLLGNSILNDADEIRSIIGVSPQETAIARRLTVFENLMLIAEIHGFSKKDSHKRVADMMDRFDLGSVAKRPAGTLSGGWQRRLSIALALITDPQILFLDEPTLGLDVIARSELWSMIRSLKGEHTVILTTHYLEEAEQLSDRTGILKSGRLFAVGTPEEIKRSVGCDRFEDAFIKLVQSSEPSMGGETA